MGLYNEVYTRIDIFRFRYYFYFQIDGKGKYKTENKSKIHNLNGKTIIVSKLDCFPFLKHSCVGYYSIIVVQSLFLLYRSGLVGLKNQYLSNSINLFLFYGKQNIFVFFNWIWYFVYECWKIGNTMLMWNRKLRVAR